MNSEAKTFSIRAVILTAIVSFLISGVGGALFQRNLDKAKPIIVISSAGFDGGDEFIELEDRLIALSNEDSWGGSFSKFENFDVFRARDIDAADTESRLNKGITTAKHWLNSNREGGQQLSEGKLLEYPYLNDSIYGSFIHGVIRRRELKLLPESNLDNYQAIFPVFKKDGDPLVHTGKKGTRFPSEGFFNQEMFRQNMSVAESISKGVRANLVSLMEQFIERSEKDLLTIKNLREALQATLLRAARPTLVVTIHNAGGHTVAFRPYFGMAVLGSEENKVTDRYLMTPEISDKTEDAPKPTNSLLATLLGMENTGANTRPTGKPYLPQSGELAYITLPPGETKNVKLIATESLGDRGGRYNSSYESGLLKVKLLGLTISGDPSWSDVHIFGSNINSEDKEEILSNLE